MKTKNLNTQRGMKKWQPFNALEHYDDYIYSTYKIKEQISKPILSEEQTNEINENLSKYNHDEVEIIYYKQGEIFKTKGIINKIDVPNQSLTINKNKIFFSNLLKIKYDI
jgi:hypothetical protein